MIKHFKHKGLERYFLEGSKAGINPQHAAKLSRQLLALDNAQQPTDMNIAGWRFHALSGDLAGHYSITVNANWRMTFVFEGQDVFIVDYQDYH